MPRKRTPKATVETPNHAAKIKLSPAVPAAEALSFLRETRGLSKWRSAWYWLGNSGKITESSAPPPVRESVQGQGWVTWATTIAIFLAIVATFIVVFLLRYALRRTPRRRLEPRTSTRVRLELSSLDGPSIHEITFTKNVSHHGACALSKNRWVPNNTVQVRFADRAASSRARIAYCNPFHDVFVIGLQFSTAIHC